VFDRLAPLLERLVDAAVRFAQGFGDRGDIAALAFETLRLENRNWFKNKEV
jgi:hypothetical protein